jgi:hypothetical protein
MPRGSLHSPLCPLLPAAPTCSQKSSGHEAAAVSQKMSTQLRMGGFGAAPLPARARLLPGPPAAAPVPRAVAPPAVGEEEGPGWGGVVWGAAEAMQDCEGSSQMPTVAHTGRYSLFVPPRNSTRCKCVRGFQLQAQPTDFACRSSARTMDQVCFSKGCMANPPTQPTHHPLRSRTWAKAVGAVTPPRP